MSDPCPVCASLRSIALDARADVPIIMNRVYETAKAGLAAPRGPLELVGCQVCGFVWNRAFQAELITYDGDYENDQTHSMAFSDHLRARAEDVVAAVPQDERVDYLEIGCGQGRFIVEVARAAGDRLASAEGFDPAWRGKDGEGPAGSRIHNVYFNAQTAGRLTRPPNVVASRHTIEHVPDPVAFLTALRTALGPDARARVFIETPCVSWIFEQQAMQDFFYEHCSLFTAYALGIALQKANFRSPRVEHVFGGQYLWASAATYGPDEVLQTGQPVGLQNLAGARAHFAEHWREQVRAAAARGPVALWGAGAKGVTFALMTDPERRFIDHVVDINPSKQNRYIAGSGLVVLGPEEAAKRGAVTIFVMNPNYFDEIEMAAADAGMNARLVPIN